MKRTKDALPLHSAEQTGSQPTGSIRSESRSHYPADDWQPIRVRPESRSRLIWWTSKISPGFLATQRTARTAIRFGTVLILLIVIRIVWQQYVFGLDRDVSKAQDFQSTKQASQTLALIETDQNTTTSFTANQTASSIVNPIAHTAISTTISAALGMTTHSTAASSHAASSVSASSATDLASARSTTGSTRILITASTAAAKKPEASGSVSVYDNVTVTASTFPGIDPLISSKWHFPMKYEPRTPGIGLFGATRSNKRSHAGIDLYAPSGTIIYAMTDGRVRNIDVFYQGLMSIEVENLDGTTIRYTELAPLVAIGDPVKQGQALAKLRKNYDGTCMLHLEIYATISPDTLTNMENQSDYLHVPVESRSYRRRSDLVDPSAVYSLVRPTGSNSHP